MKQIHSLSLLLFCAYVLSGLAACQKDDDNNTGLEPKGVRPDWGPSINDEMLVAIEALQSLGGMPIETLIPQQARQQPTLTDAVSKVIQENNLEIPSSQILIDTSGRDIPVPGGTIHARIYKPTGATGSLPLIVYYQGGGWVIANLDVYDPTCRALTVKTNAIVVSVQYRKGPEYKFPTAHNDAFEAYKWVLQNAASLNGDTARIAVAGESAGGNLACNVSIMARDNGVKLPRHQLLVYPVADNNLEASSVNRYADAKPLNKAMLPWFFMYYLNNMSESSDPRIKLISANLNGLPPTTIINAEIDPLLDSGSALEDALESAGVDVVQYIYKGVTHEFFGAAVVLPEAEDAQNKAVDALKADLQ